MIQKKLLVLALFVLGLMISCSKDDGPSTPVVETPTIATIAPNSGPVGTPFVITGTNFSTTPSKNTVKIGATTAMVTAATVTTITTSVPQGATTGKVSVTVDGKTGSSTGNFTVTPPVSNNQVPVIANEDASFNVDETIADDFIIGTIDATDADQNDVLTYVLTGTNSALFEISATGDISLASGEFLDFETTTDYTLSVTVSDGKGGVATTDFTINIVDVNEAPNLENSAPKFTVPEDISDADIIGTVVATDPEGVDLDFSILKDVSFLFEINEAGELSLIKNKALDFETATEHTLTVEVSDGTNTVGVEVTVTVTDVDEGLADDPASFITTWTTENDNEDIGIGLELNLSGEYDFQIDWGDGNLEDYPQIATVNLTHTYTTAGTYTVAIKGSFPAIKMSVGGSTPLKLTSIEQWGTNVWLSMNRAFYECQNVLVNATDIPDVSQVINMSNMFYNTLNMNNPDFSEWSTGNVTNMSQAFENSSFNGLIDNWNTSNVANMSSMFKGAILFNKNLPWDVSNVTNFSAMFDGATAFNKSLGDWNIVSVTNMENMLDNSGLSTANYDATLFGWREVILSEGTPFGITLGALGLLYCDPDNQRTFLDLGANWSFIGDSLDPECP
jgi:surface protein